MKRRRPITVAEFHASRDNIGHAVIATLAVLVLAGTLAWVVLGMAGS